MKIGSYEIQVPFVTTSVDNVKIAVELADLKPGQTIADLGSGDGRVVLAFAKKGATVHGYEIKPDLVKRSRERAEDAGLDNVKIFQQSYWNADFSTYDLIYIYGMHSIMGRLEKKLNIELKAEAKVVTNIFPLPNWKHAVVKNGVYLYSPIRATYH